MADEHELTIIDAAVSTDKLAQYIGVCTCRWTSKRSNHQGVIRGWHKAHVKGKAEREIWR